VDGTNDSGVKYIEKQYLLTLPLSLTHIKKKAKSKNKNLSGTKY